ncbi:hypothetical protein [Nostoc sp. FACHB-190]|nr:hypothetical protein [Nostoc sp. FACHB-190]
MTFDYGLLTLDYQLALICQNQDKLVHKGERSLSKLDKGFT